MKEHEDSDLKGYGEIARFRVYPDNGTRYFIALVFKSKRSMLRFKNKHVHPYCKKTFEAAVYPQDHISKSGRKYPILGYILFHKGYLGCGVVSHEMVHAALAFLRRDKKSLDLTDDNICQEDEERVAMIQENLVRQFVDRGHKKGLWN